MRSTNGLKPYAVKNSNAAFSVSGKTQLRASPRQMRAARTFSLGLTSVIALVLHSYHLISALLCPAAYASRPPGSKHSPSDSQSPHSSSHGNSPWIDCKVSPRARTLGDFHCPSLAAAASPHAQHHHAGTHAAHAETHAGTHAAHAETHAGHAADGSDGGAASSLPGGLHGGVTAWSRHYVESVLALRHAPLLYHHPLERHFLTDPVKVCAGGGACRLGRVHMLALSHAPLLYHQPLERYFLTDPVNMCEYVWWGEEAGCRETEQVHS